MALEELRAVEAYQWCPSGNPLEVRPGVASVFIAGAEGTPQSYGYGDGWSIVFGSSQGEIHLEPESWIVRLSNGVISVEQEAPGGAEVLSHEQVLERYRR